VIWCFLPESAVATLMLSCTEKSLGRASAQPYFANIRRLFEIRIKKELLMRCHGDKHERYGKHRNGEKENGERDNFWCEVHEMSAQLMLILIVLHVIEVVVSSKMHNENPVKSMITGKKACMSRELHHILQVHHVKIRRCLIA
jgi:hypothetical protein